MHNMAAVFANTKTHSGPKQIIVYHGHETTQDRTVPVSERLRYFDAVVSSAACFAGRLRTMYKEHMQILDLHFRKFCRSIVGASAAH